MEPDPTMRAKPLWLMRLRMNNDHWLRISRVTGGSHPG